MKRTGAWWWIDRWRKSTAFTDMTAEEQGLYRNLLDEVWLREDHLIPDDPRILARVSGDPEAWTRCSAKVLQWMVKRNGGWTHETALEVIEQAAKRAEKQARYRERLLAKAGNNGGNGEGNTDGSPSPSPSPSPLPEERSTATTTCPDSLNASEREEYARTAWEAWLERRGRGGPEMSSAEWVLITGWMDRAVPLRVVLRGIADCGGKLNPSTSLRYAAPAVLEAIEHWRKSQCL